MGVRGTARLRKSSTGCVPRALNELLFPSISVTFRRPIANFVLFDSCLIPGPVLNPNRRPQEPKSLAYLVLQKPLIRKVQLNGPVGEKHKRRRRDRGLSHVKNFHT